MPPAPKSQSVSNPPNKATGKRREHGERMQIALVKNRQDHVHDEHRYHHQDRKIMHRVSECEGLALQRSLNPLTAAISFAVCSTNWVAGPIA